jgi:hypothetical protein
MQIRQRKLFNYALSGQVNKHSIKKDFSKRILLIFKIILY